MNKPLETIGFRLRQARTAQDLTIPEVSDRTRISRGNLSHLENDKGKPSSDALINLSQLYEVSTDWILKGANYAPTGFQEKKGTYKYKAPQGGPVDPSSQELTGFMDSILKSWEQGDPVTRGWIVGQLRKAFPEIAEMVRKE